MRHLIAVALALTTFTSIQAQEKLGREESLKYAFFASANLKEMLQTPIPTDPDVKRPVAVKEGDYGGMVLPESKLTVEAIAKAGQEVVPVGQLWMVKLAPVNDGNVVPQSKLKIVHVQVGDAEADVPCCALGVRKTSEGALELLVYGKGKEPVAKVPMKSISLSQEPPIDMTGERRDDGGSVTLRFFGKYEATIQVTDPDQA